MTGKSSSHQGENRQLRNKMQLTVASYLPLLTGYLLIVSFARSIKLQYVIVRIEIKIQSSINSICIFVWSQATLHLTDEYVVGCSKFVYINPRTNLRQTIYFFVYLLSIFKCLDTTESEICGFVWEICERLIVNKKTVCTNFLRSILFLIPSCRSTPCHSFTSLKCE